MPNPVCVLCKIELDNPEQYLFVCPNCNKEYVLDYEILAYDDDVGTAYDDEAETIETEGLAATTGPRMEIKEDELDFPTKDEEMEEEYNDQRGKIPIPDYMKNSDTTEVIEYREE